MMIVAALLLQLTLWVATVHAFFPFIPPEQCDPDEPCGVSVSATKRAGPGSTAEGLTLDLYRGPRNANGGSADSDPVAAAAARLSRKFGRSQHSPTSELEKRKNTYAVSEPTTPTTPNSAGIYQYGPDYSYFIKVQVGSAQQQFFMLLDTGASNTWLMGSNCKSEACLMHDTFDPSSSESFRTENKAFSISYGSGDLKGTVGEDTVSFAGLTVDVVSFGLANYTHPDFRHFAFDGILGLSMGASVTGTFLQTLKAKKLVDSLVVSMSLNRDSDGSNDGQVTFGGVDKAKYTGEISYNNIQSPQKERGEWAIKMDALGFNGTKAGVANRLSYIDTGTSFVFAPPDDLDALFKLVPGSSSFKNGDYMEYRVPCDTTLPINLSFGGVTYGISARDWVAQKSENECISNLYGYEVFEGAWLVGDTFLKNVYSVFDADQMRIGFASKPAPPPKATTTSSGASFTTLSAAATSVAVGDSAQPVMPGLNNQQSTGVPHTQVNGGNQLGTGFSVSVLCVAAVVAALGRQRIPQLGYRCTASDSCSRMASERSAAHRRRHGASPSPSSGNSHRNNNEEATGLLAATDPAENGDDDDHHHHHHRNSGHIVHPGDPDDDNDDDDDDYANPRTPHRVRFDLRPTIVSDGRTSNGSAEHDDNPYPQRESLDFDLDSADPLSRNTTTPHSRQQRVPLLTGIEAPSVTVATTAAAASAPPTDAEAWLASELRRPKSSLPSAFMNMANSIIGAGIIGQPYALRQAGLLAGSLLLVFLTVVVDWTIRLIVVNSKLSGSTSFQGTVERCFGRTGLVAISVAQWAFAFGGMVAFGVIVGDSIPSVLRAVWPGLRDMPVVGWLADRRVVIVLFTLGVSYPLALYRDIAKLAKASTLALVSMAVIVVTVIVQGMMVPAAERGSLKDWRLLVINDGIFQAIGVISFAFVCHHNSLLIYGSLEKPTIDRFSKVTHVSTAVSMLACLLMALAGFLTFGDKTQGNVLNNFPADNTMVNIARLCFGLNMLTTLPLEAFVCREVMLNYYFPGEPFNMNLHLIFTSSLVFSAMVLSLVTCDLGTIFDLVGGTSAAAMAYILPPLCYIKLTTRSWKTRGRYKAVLLTNMDR
ncbi:acid protease [Parathielavia hyrcaniae]|uniref:Acid protease n=1 Tax=Parathielavia hyrcaniae TaxID=113614 RepID=A0AAN6T3H3_9PEZI|nr:acid protease [Parathielavia hyrcaniae]